MSIHRDQVETDDLVLYCKLVSQVNADFCKILLSNKSNYRCDSAEVQTIIMQRAYVDFFVKLGFKLAESLKDQTKLYNLTSVINADIYNSYSKKIDALQSVYSESSILKDKIKTLLNDMIDELSETKKVYTHLLFLLNLKTPPTIESDSKTREIREKLTALFCADEPIISSWKKHFTFQNVIILLIIVLLAYVVYVYFNKPKSVEQPQYYDD